MQARPLRDAATVWPHAYRAGARARKGAKQNARKGAKQNARKGGGTRAAHSRKAIGDHGYHNELVGCSWRNDMLFCDRIVFR